MRTDKKGRPVATPTALAAMGKCPRELALGLRHGKRVSEKSRQAMARGIEAHKSFETEIRGGPSERPQPQWQPAPPSRRDSRCFVASWALGPDHPDTEALREFRDRALMINTPGRLLVKIYYALSPGLIRILAPIPGACSTCSKIVSWIAGRVR